MYINLTPHDVVIYQGDRIVETVAPSGTVARLGESAEPYAAVDGVDYHRVILGEPVGLPEPAAGTMLIVSMPMLMALAASGIHRPDVVYPYGQVRDASGRIIGCRSLATLGAYPAVPGGRHS